MTSTLEAIGDMCAFGMSASDAWGEALVMKLTSYLTSSQGNVGKLSQRCDKQHRHVHLVWGRARAASEYHRLMIDAMLDGYGMEQLS